MARSAYLNGLGGSVIVNTTGGGDNVGTGGSGGGSGGGRGGGRNTPSNVKPFFRLSQLETSDVNGANVFNINHDGGRIFFIQPHLSVDSTKYPDSDWIKPKEWISHFTVNSDKEIEIHRPYTIVQKVGTGQDFIIPEEMTNLSFSMSFEPIEDEENQVTSSIYQGSYADITIGNLRTYSGDVHRTKIFAKRQGHTANGFFKVADFALQPDNQLIDTTSLSGQAPIGLFYTQSVIDNNWQTSSATVSATLRDTYLVGGISLSGSNENVNDSYTFETKNNMVFTKGEDYQVLFDLQYFKADKSGSYTAENDAIITVEPHAEIEVYLSGSIESSDDDVEYSLGTFSSDETSPDFSDVLSNTSGSIRRVYNIFRTHNITNQISSGSLGFRIKSGRFDLSAISITPFVDQNFNPGFTKVSVPMPVNDEADVRYDFLAEFYDFNNNKSVQLAETSASVLFAGPRKVISITGDDIWDGTATIGRSILLHGSNPAFLSSVGYNGFDKTIGGSGARNGGFLLFSGSIGSGATENFLTASEAYDGVGIEIVDAQSSNPYEHRFLKFRTNPAEFRVQTNQFLLGVSGSGGPESYISSSGNVLEISSSNFLVSASGDVVMQGTITATAGGQIGGFTIASSSISNTDFFLSGSNYSGTGFDETNLVLSSSGFQINSNGSFKATTGEIGSFSVDPTTISSSNDALIMHSDGRITGSTVDFDGGSIGGFGLSSNSISSSNNNLKLFDSGIISGSDVHFNGGKIGGLSIDGKGVFIGTSYRISSSTDALDPVAFISSSDFKVGAGGQITASSGLIGGFTTDATTITGGNLILNKAGTIQSSGYSSGVIAGQGTGFILSAEGNGYLEVDKARIRGTLSTAVFEKESVNAVGGMLMVANSTVLSASVSATDTTMSVENASGFTGSYNGFTGGTTLSDISQVDGEILMIKKVDNTGFSTEYVLVQSASFDDPSAAAAGTNPSGKLYVTRSFGGAQLGTGESPTTESFATDGGGTAYTPGQVIASTGRYISGTGASAVGTGYIFQNANPNDQYSPYIDIVERTGSKVYDMDLKVRVGDLSGLSQARLLGTAPADAGFGMYAKNVFLEGGITANTGSIAGIKMDSNKLYAGAGNHGQSDTPFYLSGDSGATAGDFSLKDAFVWDASAETLTIKGAIRQTSAGVGITDLVNKGTWAASTAYVSGSDLVSYESSGITSTYICKNSHTSTNDTDSTTGRPDTATNSWNVFAQGSAGTDGDSAKVVSLAADQYAVLYDGDGNKTAVAITLTATPQNTTSTQYRFLENGVERQAFSTTATYTIPDSQEPAEDTADTWTVEIREGGSGTAIASDTVSIYGIGAGTDGQDGSSAKTLVISSNTPVFSFDDSDDTTPTPTTATITVNQQNGSGNLVTGDISVTNGTKSSFSYSGTSGTGTATVTITPSGTYPVTVSVTKDSITDSLQIPKVQGGLDGTNGSPGADAYTVVLTNESHTLPTTNTGTVTYTNSGTSIIAYKGNTELDGVTSAGSLTTGKFSASVVSDTNITADTTFTSAGNPLVYGDASVCTADNASITYKVSLEGTDTEIEKVQSLSKANQGTDGDDGDDAYTVILTNESVTLPANNSGTVSSYALSGTNIIAYKGTTELDGVTSAGSLTTNKFSASVSATSNITADTTFDSSGNPLVYGVASSMTADNASITYLISLEGTGTQFEKVQTFTKAKAGGDGVDGGAGPGVVFRGTYSASDTYFSSSIRRDVVVYSSNYYISKVNNTTAGTPGGSDWEAFGGQFTSVATNILLAQDATITNGLVIGDGSNDGFIRSYDATSETAGAGFFMIDDHSTGTAKFRVGTATNANPPNYMYFNGSSLDIQATSFNLAATSSNAGIIIDSANSTFLATGSNASTDGNAVIIDGDDGIIEVRQGGTTLNPKFTFRTGQVDTFTESAKVILKSVPTETDSGSANIAYVSMSDAVVQNNLKTRRITLEHANETFFRQVLDNKYTTSESFHIVKIEDLGSSVKNANDTPGSADLAYTKKVYYSSGIIGTNQYQGQHAAWSSWTRNNKSGTTMNFVGAGGTGSAEYLFQSKYESGSGGWTEGSHSLMRLEVDFAGMTTAHKTQFALMDARTITSSNQVKSVMQIQHDGGIVSRGNISAYATSFMNVSDERLKENIYELTGSMNKVLGLRPTEFTWKENKKQDIGFIAQEVEEIIPEVVETGNTFIGENELQDIKTVSYTKLIPYLVDTIQQLNKRIEELEKKVK